MMDPRAAKSLDYASRRAAKRARDLKRLEERGIIPAPAADPPTRPRRPWLPAVYVLASVAAHLLLPSLLAALPLGSGGGLAPERRPEQVVIRVTDPPPPREIPEPVETAVPVEVAEATPPPERPSVKKIKRPRRPIERADADPVDTESPPPKEPERRRIAGISMESTVSTGAGPAFATGNTRMGETAAVAKDTKDLGKAVADGSRGAQRQIGAKELSARIPSAGVTFTKPVRKRPVVLDYPVDLKVRGIEGNVVVLLKISVTGKVEDVKVLRSSGFSQFDDAAVRAARKEAYSPAMREGEPVEYSLKYTYRFRITGA